ncbi:MAG: ribosome small subunit-dependent GTPase A [Clostridia bacterium]|nr:ribosome small subunit-dependent GTPase A [Clostridia bacterium]
MKFETNGRVVKGLGGLYDVRYTDASGAVRYVSVRAKGVLRLDDERVLVGDLVTVSGDDAVPDGTVISRILPRRCALIRPPLSNLDLLFVVFAARSPSPVTETIDKMICIAEHNRIEPVIVITKADLSDEDAQRYAAIYRKAGFEVFVTSHTRPSDLDPLKQYIQSHVTDGRTAAFAGASGVGKTTLMNGLFPSLSLPTAHISRKIERGRHTTRHVELFAVRGDDPSTGFVADTPGFSLLDFERFDFLAEEDLVATFREFSPYVGKCTYADCSHGGEGADSCAIARAAEQGRIAPSRLSSYRSILSVLKHKTTY